MFQQAPVLFQLAPLVGLFETVDKVSVKPIHPHKKIGFNITPKDIIS